MTIANLIRAEVRRALHRRVVWVLVAVALIGIGVLGAIAWFDSTGRTAAEMTASDDHPAVMETWWVAAKAEGILLIAVGPLLIGGLLGGASVFGAEWRAGTVTTMLTWEPRRLRVHAARAVTSFVLATLFALVLQVLFLASTVPAVLAHGTTAGVDGAWWAALIAAVARIALLTGVAALLGGSLATVGRGTAFALGGIFGWVAVAEPLVRGLKPRLTPYLLGENLVVVARWAPLEAVADERSALAALATVVFYIGAAGAVAVVAFTRRDVAAVA